MSVLITGVAGFIGHAVAKRLLEEGHEVFGIDNLNDYYDPDIKCNRLAELRQCQTFKFQWMEVQDWCGVEDLFQSNQFEYVIHLAAQAGVRYSVKNPRIYLESNVFGFLSILEACRRFPVKQLLYASSSSAKEVKSIYAISKLTNELMAKNYLDIHHVPSIGMRFFSVYGPNGRPDMALKIFIDKITRGEPIELFNHGDCKRSFTYIDDVVTSVVELLHSLPGGVVDIGNPESRSINDMVSVLEKIYGNVRKTYLPMQDGDVLETQADPTFLQDLIGFVPSISLEEGIPKCV